MIASIQADYLYLQLPSVSLVNEPSNTLAERVVKVLIRVYVFRKFFGADIS